MLTNRFLTYTERHWQMRPNKEVKETYIVGLFLTYTERHRQIPEMVLFSNPWGLYSKSLIISQAAVQVLVRLSRSLACSLARVRGSCARLGINTTYKVHRQRRMKGQVYAL